MTDPDSLPTTDREPNLCPYCDNPELGQHVCPPTRVELAFLRRGRDPERAAKWASDVLKRWMESPAGLLAVRRLKEGAR